MFDFDNDEIQKEMKAQGVDVATMARVIADRLKSMPLAYLEFSVYWWAVKSILAQNGYNFGAFDDPYMRDLHTLQDHKTTLFVAFNVADANRSYYFHGTHEMKLNDDGETYALYDPDME